MKAGYLCKGCGADREFDVRPRKQSENILAYVRYLGKLAALDHGFKSPDCHKRECDLKLPITTNGIGYAGDKPSNEQMAALREQLADARDKDAEGP